MYAASVNTHHQYSSEICIQEGLCWQLFAHPHLHIDAQNTLTQLQYTAHSSCDAYFTNIAFLSGKTSYERIYQWYNARYHS